MATILSFCCLVSLWFCWFSSMQLLVCIIQELSRHRFLLQLLSSLKVFSRTFFPLLKRDCLHNSLHNGPRSNTHNYRQHVCLLFFCRLSFYQGHRLGCLFFFFFWGHTNHTPRMWSWLCLGPGGIKSLRSPLRAISSPLPLFSTPDAAIRHFHRSAAALGSQGSAAGCLRDGAKGVLVPYDGKNWAFSSPARAHLLSRAVQSAAWSCLPCSASEEERKLVPGPSLGKFSPSARHFPCHKERKSETRPKTFPRRLLHLQL